MSTVLLLIELFVTLALIGIVLIQRSEGGGLGIGGSQGMGSFMSGRGTANLLTRTTAILAAIFMILALAIGLLNRGGTGSSILDMPPPSTHTAPLVSPSKAPALEPAPAHPRKSVVKGRPVPATPAPSTAAPTQPSVPTGPSVPTQ